MTNNKKIPLLVFPLILGSTLLLSACDKHKEISSDQARPSSQHTTTDALQTPQVKTFPVTVDDPHDIALLDDFDERFTAMSDDMENELANMQQDGTLTPAFEQNRKLDHIRSALDMLKALDLKTAQGRYIQGLLYQYWENQSKLLNAQSPNKTATTVQNLSDYLQAQEQLKHWKDQQKAA